MTRRRRKALLALMFALAALIGFFVVGDLPREAGLDFAVATSADPESSPRRGPRWQSPESLDDRAIASPRVTVVVRDLADGSVVPGLAFELSGKRRSASRGSTEPTLTSVDGELLIERELLPSVSIVADGWHLPRQTATEIEQAGELWCYRDAHVTGSVRDSENPSEPVDARIEFQIPSTQVGELPGNESPPWSLVWFSKHGIQTHRRLGRLNAAGEFAVTVPRIRGISLIASLRDRRHGWANVMPTSTRVEYSVEIEVQQRNWVIGRLLGDESRPLEDGHVQVFAYREVEVAELDYAALALGGDAYSFQHGPSVADGRARIVAIGGAASYESGRFRVPINSVGDGLVVAHVEGYLPVSRSVDLMNGGRDAGEILLVRAWNRQEVRVLHDGRELPGCTLVLGDLSSRIGQPAAPTLTLNSESAFWDEWLIAGREYVVSVEGAALKEVCGKPSVAGRLVWTRRDTLELSSDLRPLSAP